MRKGVIIFRNSLWGSVTYGQSLHGLYNTKSLRTPGLDDRHGPSPILCDTVLYFAWIDQLFWRCYFIYSNFHWLLVSLLRDGYLYCLLHEKINQSNIRLHRHVCAASIVVAPRWKEMLVDLGQQA